MIFVIYVWQQRHLSCFVCVVIWFDMISKHILQCLLMTLSYNMLLLTTVAICLKIYTDIIIYIFLFALSTVTELHCVCNTMPLISLSQQSSLQPLNLIRSLCTEAKQKIKWNVHGTNSWKRTLKRKRWKVRTSTTLIVQLSTVLPPFVYV